MGLENFKNLFRQGASRRRTLQALTALSGWGALAFLFQKKFRESAMTKSGAVIQKRFPLGFQWETQEPFLFCVHHDDKYPRGNSQWGPDPSTLTGRDLGQDFTPKDGFRMYHGKTVPGFPVHPHRGFETITIVREGYVDHADSMGAAGRYGQGDVQWMTAGGGVQHSEMFPLLKNDRENPLELFQIWLNLPKAKKMVSPHFKMLWSENIPSVSLQQGRVRLTVIAGDFAGQKPPAPPPDSWAAQTESETLIVLIKLSPHSSLSLPVTSQLISRTLYAFSGKNLKINDQDVEDQHGFVVDSTKATTLSSLDSEIELLLLQAMPIGEPVVQYGPFVMTSREDIAQTIQDYQKTQFGGWPWEREDMVHGASPERFAKHPDGRVEKPNSKS